LLVELPQRQIFKPRQDAGRLKVIAPFISGLAEANEAATALAFLKAWKVRRAKAKP
jgi:hypothetical protein